MAVLYKKNRALNRILRNKFRSPAISARPLPEAAQTAPAPASTSAYSFSTDIPESYNDTYVRSIPKDPQNTFVYWEIPKAEKKCDENFSNHGSIHTENDHAKTIERQLRVDDHKQHNTSSGNTQQYFDFGSNSWCWGNVGEHNRHENNRCYDNNYRHDDHHQHNRNDRQDAAFSNSHSVNEQQPRGADIIKQTNIGSAYIEGSSCSRTDSRNETNNRHDPSLLPHLSSGVLYDNKQPPLSSSALYNNDHPNLSSGVFYASTEKRSAS